MTTGVLKQQIIAWLLKANRHRRQGFTLIELLVSIIIGSIVVSALLYLVTELNRFNGREELLTQTQQDMRRALDFISSDISESVYVYTDPDPIANQLDDAPDDTEPILAFWRLDPVDTSSLDDDCEDSSNEAECSTLKVRQSAYTLVVYFQTTVADDNPIWEGESRIIRYQLPKYGSGANDIEELNHRSGYLDPTLEETTFAGWNKDAGENTDGDSQVLVDFVDSFNDTIPANRTCESRGFGAPSETPVAKSNSFLVCVSSGDTDEETAGFDDTLLNRTNQSVFIALTGNAARQDNDVLTSASSEASRLPTLESEVLIRGVIEKPQ